MMPFKNTDSQFGLMSIVLHWVMAFLMIAIFIIGIWMTRIQMSLFKLNLFRWHKEWGMLVLILGLIRLVWRWSNPLPTLSELSMIERMAARFVHAVLYVFILILPLTGWILSSAAGIAVSLFGYLILPNWVSTNEEIRILFTELHQWLAYTFIAVLCLHTAGALKHYFINRDSILQRMLWP